MARPPSVSTLQCSHSLWLQEAEGEGFDPSSDPRARNGFRDRRIRPLCHPSEGRTGYPPSGDGDVQPHAGCLVPRHGAVELVLPGLQRHLQLGAAARRDQLRLVARPLDRKVVRNLAVVLRLEGDLAGLEVGRRDSDLELGLADRHFRRRGLRRRRDRKSTRLNSSHRTISYAVFCLKKKKNKIYTINKNIIKIK